MRRAKRGIAAALAICILPLLAACGAGASGSEPIVTPSPSQTATEAPTVTSTLTGTPTGTHPSRAPATIESEIAPPVAKLASSAGTQEAEIGTYCWTEGNQGLCVDFVGLVFPEKPLSVDRGEELTISVPGIDRIANVNLAVYDHAHTETGGDTPVIVYPLPDSHEVPYADDGVSVTMTADLPPGEYVVWLFVSFPADSTGTPEPNATVTSATGDAQYGFHLVVD